MGIWILDSSKTIRDDLYAQYYRARSLVGSCFTVTLSEMAGDILTLTSWAGC